MNTEEAEKQLKPYLIGDLTPKEEAILEGHIDVNEAAQWYHQRYYRQTLPILKQPEAAPSEGVLENLFAKARIDLANEEIVLPTPMRALKGGISRHWKIAAMFIVAFGVTLGLMLSQGKRETPANAGIVSTINANTGNVETERLVFGQTVNVGKNQIKVIEFASGVTMRLSEFTQVKFDRKSEAHDGHVTNTLKADLLRGDLLVSTKATKLSADGHGHGAESHSATTGISKVVVSRVHGDESAALKEINLGNDPKGSLVQFSYTPRFSEVRQEGQLVFLDLKRQEISELTSVAKHFGKEIRIAPEASTSTKHYRDVPTGLYSWTQYRKALEELEFVFEDAGSHLVLKDVGAGRADLVANGDVSEIVSMVNFQDNQAGSAVLKSIKLFGGEIGSNDALAFEDRMLRTLVSKSSAAKTIKLNAPRIGDDGSLIYTTLVDGESAEVTLRRDYRLEDANLNGVKGTFVRAMTIGSGEGAKTRIFFNDGGELKTIDVDAHETAN